MRSAVLFLFLTSIAASTARAELDFPVFERLPAEERDRWGYVVDRTGSSFHLTIPAKSSPLHRRARLTIRDATRAVIAESDVTAGPTKNHTLEYSFTLSPSYAAELVIYTAVPHGSAMETWKRGFGGFTFALPARGPNKAPEPTTTSVMPAAEQPSRRP